MDALVYVFLSVITLALMALGHDPEPVRRAERQRLLDQGYTPEQVERILRRCR